jgi:hypothetical protein
MIYRGNVPLVWRTDEETQSHTGVLECFISFKSREIASQVMREVPSLFDMDEDDEMPLNLREIDIPS